MAVNPNDVASILAAAFGFGAAYFGWLNQRKIKRTDEKVKDIHVTLNSRLSEWNAQLMDQVSDLKSERDKLQVTNDDATSASRIATTESNKSSSD